MKRCDVSVHCPFGITTASRANKCPTVGNWLVYVWYYEQAAKEGDEPFGGDIHDGEGPLQGRHCILAGQDLRILEFTAKGNLLFRESSGKSR